MLTSSFSSQCTIACHRNGAEARSLASMCSHHQTFAAYGKGQHCGPWSHYSTLFRMWVVFLITFGHEHKLASCFYRSLCRRHPKTWTLQIGWVLKSREKTLYWKSNKNICYIQATYGMAPTPLPTPSTSLPPLPPAPPCCPFKGSSVRPQPSINGIPISDQGLATAVPRGFCSYLFSSCQARHTVF